MADDKSRKFADEALSQFDAELKAGKTEALQNYLTTVGRFPHYSWRNDLLIATQLPTASDVRTHHAWADCGRHVKDGEKGIMIYAPVLAKQGENGQGVQNSDQAVPKKSGLFRLTGFRVTYVFDVGQTEGKPVLAFARATGDPNEFAEKLKSLVAKQCISIEYDKLVAPAQGVSHEGKIRMAPDLQPPAEFFVLTRELAREMLHHKPGTSRLQWEIEQTQANAVAYVVCRRVGLQPNPAAVNDTNIYDGGKRALAESLSAIHDASSRILDELLPPERPSPFHEKPADRTLANGSTPTHEAPARPSLSPTTSTSQVPDQPISFDR